MKCCIWMCMIMSGDATLVDEAEMTVADLVATLPTNQGMTIIDDEQNATASQSTELSASDLTSK